MPCFWGGPRSDPGRPHPTTTTAWLWNTGAVSLLEQGTGTPVPQGQLARSSAGAEGKASQGSAAAAPRHRGGRSPPSTPGPHSAWLQAAPGAQPPLAGSLRPGSAKADSSAGGATIPRPPLASTAVPSCSHDPFPEPKGPKAEAGGCLPPCPGVSTQGIPTGSRDTLRKARSRGDGSAPGVSGIGILVGMCWPPGLSRILGRSCSGQSPAVTSNRPKGPAPQQPERLEPACFVPDHAKRRLGVSLDARGRVWYGTSFVHRHNQFWDASGSASGHAHLEPLCI